MSGDGSVCECLSGMELVHEKHICGCGKAQVSVEGQTEADEDFVALEFTCDF